MLLLQIFRRKKVGVLATQKWGKQLPKFNTPEKRNELEHFAKEISAEVVLPEVGFGVEDIMQHTKDFFNEQRRQRKINTVSLKWFPIFDYWEEMLIL